jgi:hypothetical protein
MPIVVRRPRADDWLDAVVTTANPSACALIGRRSRRSWGSASAS